MSKRGVKRKRGYQLNHSTTKVSTKRQQKKKENKQKTKERTTKEKKTTNKAEKETTKQRKRKTKEKKNKGKEKKRKRKKQQNKGKGKEKKRKRNKIYHNEKRRLLEPSLAVFSFFDLKRKRKRWKRSIERFFFVHPRSVVLFWSFVVLLLCG